MTLQKNRISFNRRTKRQVLSALRKRGVWRGWLVPSKCYPNPDHPFNTALQVELGSQMLEYENEGDAVTPLERLLNEFEVYNCNPELGRSIHYYEIEEEEK